MKLIFLASFFLLNSTAFAAPNPEILKSAVESLPSCQSFIRYDNDYVFDGVNRQLIVASIANPAQRIQLSLGNSSVDVARNGDRLFVLTAFGIEEWSLSQQARVGTYASYVLNRPFAYQENPTGMVAYGDKLFISHGRLGVSVFDTKSKTIINQFRLVASQMPLESMATGITANGNKAYLVMDNFTMVSGDKPPLRGIVIVNMDSQEVEAELDGMDPGADAIVSDGQKVIVSFMGQPIWKYNLASLGGRSMPEPEERIFRFPEIGHPTGKPAMDSKYYYTCFAKAPDSGSGYFQHVLRVWNRKVMLLD